MTTSAIQAFQANSNHAPAGQLSKGDLETLRDCEFKLRQRVVSLREDKIIKSSIYQDWMAIKKAILFLGSEGFTSYKLPEKLATKQQLRQLLQRHRSIIQPSHGAEGQDEPQNTSDLNSDALARRLDSLENKFNFFTNIFKQMFVSLGKLLKTNKIVPDSIFHKATDLLKLSTQGRFDYKDALIDHYLYADNLTNEQKYQALVRNIAPLDALGGEIAKFKTEAKSETHTLKKQSKRLNGKSSNDFKASTGDLIQKLATAKHQDDVLIIAKNADHLINYILTSENYSGGMQYSLQEQAKLLKLLRDICQTYPRHARSYQNRNFAWLNGH